MTDENYKYLIENNFSTQQINQLIQLEKYFTIDTLIDYGITSDCNIEILRSINNIFKEYFNILEGYELDELMDLVVKNIDPNILMDFEMSQRKRDYIYEILTSHATNDDVYDVINYIKYQNVSDSLAEDIMAGYIMNKINPSAYIRKDFTSEQLKMAKFLYDIGKSKYIDDVDKLNKYVYITNVINIIDQFNLDFVNTINSYDLYNLECAVMAMVQGYNINKYLMNNSDSNDVLLCVKLIDKKLSDDKIMLYLKQFKFSFSAADIDNWDDIIDAKENGYDIDEYFCNPPTDAQVYMCKILIDMKLKKDDIIKYIDIIGNAFTEKPIDLNGNDFLKYIELNKEGYNIKSLMIDGFSSELIDIFFKAYNNDKEKINEKLSLNRFYNYEVDLMKDCIKYNRKDVCDALFHVQYSSNNAYDNIRQILKKDFENGTKHNIINLLYDKGFNVFRDFDPAFEFDQFQKACLSDAVLKEKISDLQLEMICDNSINSYVMKELIKMIDEGLDINPILTKVNDLTIVDIESIHNCMSLGFDIKIRDEKIIK